MGSSPLDRPAIAIYLSGGARRRKPDSLGKPIEEINCDPGLSDEQIAERMEARDSPLLGYAAAAARRFWNKG